MSTKHDSETIRTAVRNRYGRIATGATAPGRVAITESCCSASPTTSGGCGPDTQARTLGYSETDLAAVPEGANLGLGCGNPVALASLEAGETVLDLGAGAGFDVFLAARAVGPVGRVIGVDMTAEMVAKARANATKGGYSQVEFRLGEIEALPLADATVDVIISNCVINLCPDKRLVYREAFRVLRSGGRLAVSDIVARRELPENVQRDPRLHTGCLAGATPLAELQAILKEAGFTDIAIRAKGNTEEVIDSWDSEGRRETDVFAAEVTASKPSGDCCAPECCR